MRDRNGRFTKGSTYEETFGIEKAQELKAKGRQNLLGNKWNLGRKPTLSKEK